MSSQSLLAWTYQGAAADRASADGGRQRALPGDAGHDDELGRGIIDKMDGGTLLMEFGDGERKQIKARPSHLVYAVDNRGPRDPSRIVAPTGRSGSGMSTIGSFFGGESTSSGTKPPPPAPKPGRGSKPFASTPSRGRGRGRGKRGGDAGSSSVTTPTTEHRAQPTATAAFSVGAEHAEEGGEESTQPASKKAKLPVSLSSMSAEELAAYKKRKHEEKKEPSVQQGFKAQFSWLADDATKGWHCRLCVSSVHKASDKLSTSGYGFTDQNGESVMIPIPSTQKLRQHEEKEQHKYNAKQEALKHQGVSQSARTGSTRPFLTITPEDELYARTIRTVHTIVKRQLSLNDMYHLLELQNANGLIMSFDHASTTAGVEYGGLATWLFCGARVFQSKLRARAQPPLLTKLFPDGVPFGLMGDGSNDRSMAEQEAVVLRFLGADAKPFNAFFDLAELDLKQSVDGRSPDV